MPPKKDKLSKYANVLKLQNALRNKLLERRIDDQQIMQSMARQSENLIGNSFDERRKLDDLLEKYEEAETKDEGQIYFNQLPPNIQREIRKARIYNKGTKDLSKSDISKLQETISKIDDKVSDPAFDQLKKKINQISLEIDNPDLMFVRREIPVKMEPLEKYLNKTLKFVEKKSPVLTFKNIKPMTHYRIIISLIEKIEDVNLTTEPNYSNLQDLLEEYNNELERIVKLYEKTGKMGISIKINLPWYQEWQTLKGKAKAGPSTGNGMKVFNSEDQMKKRLNLLNASIRAGNNSKILKKEKKDLEKRLK